MGNTEGFLIEEIHTVNVNSSVSVRTVMSAAFYRWIEKPIKKSLIDEHSDAQTERSKFRSHPKGEKKKVPKPQYQKNKPHVSTD